MHDIFSFQNHSNIVRNISCVVENIKFDLGYNLDLYLWVFNQKNWNFKFQFINPRKLYFCFLFLFFIQIETMIRIKERCVCKMYISSDFLVLDRASRRSIARVLNDVLKTGCSNINYLSFYCSYQFVTIVSIWHQWTN